MAKRKIGAIFGKRKCMNILLSHEVAKKKLGISRFLLKYPLIAATKLGGFPPHFPTKEYENMVFNLLIEKNPKVFLDIGSGYGRWALSVCRETGASGICVDRDYRDLEAIKSLAGALQLNCSCFEGDILLCEFEKEQFDLIYIIETMHIITDDKRLLALVHSWLKPGGIFVFQSPFHFKQMRFNSEQRCNSSRIGYSPELFEKINHGLFNFTYYTIGKRKECPWCLDYADRIHPLKLVGVGRKF